MCSILGAVTATTNMTTILAAGERFRPIVLAGEQTLPVPEAFVAVLPMGGLVKGTSVDVSGVGATSVSLALLATTSRLGSWVAFVGTDSLGWAAVAQAGLDLTRTVSIDRPPTSRWATVTAALVDAFDVVVVDPQHQVGATDARRLAARVRERGSILMSMRPSDGRRRYRWPVQADLSLTVDDPRWAGLGEGSGHLTERVLGVSTTGRRSAGRRRRVELRLTVAGIETVIETTDMSARHLRRVV